MQRIDFVTLFPEMVFGVLGHSIMKRAEAAGHVAFGTSDPRDFTTDKHRTVDDSPFGGGPGMLMKAEPVAQAIEALGQADAIVFTDPTGSLFTQSDAATLSRLAHVVFVCGHYEGIDDRVRERLATHTFSIGDYVLTNGELPALIMADAVVRLIPGVLGKEESLRIDSHADGLLSAPQYTRPEEWRGIPVPAVLLGGNHKEIERWKRRQALLLTRSNRPDLFARAAITDADLKSLE
ncbi:MAG TPA: tRNA (guanosine(37)-N1)-methyltransferase TrmD [Fimbriimonadaceae bacterium]|nr:tRNA (guanosine(37)-N1)-methyltransferase TrmD [Fimbriimonadaceae bacterium]